MTLGIRLWKVTSPLADAYCWRQAVTASIARNFTRHGYNLLRPEGDWGGSGSGYIESELPLHPYLTAVVYGLIGVQEWVGRFLSALASVGCVYCLFLLGSRWFGVAGGLWAGAFFSLSPLTLFFGRSFQPDMLMLFFLLLGMLLLDRWCDDERPLLLASACLALTLACLTKITAVHVYPVLAVLPWRRRGWRTFTSLQLWACVLLPVIATALWYRHAAAVHSENDLVFATPTKNEWWGTWQQWSDLHLWQMLLTRFAVVDATPVVALLAAAAVMAPLAAPGRWAVRVWLLCDLVYVVGIMRGQFHHHYYQLPLVPPLALAAAGTLTLVRPKMQAALGALWPLLAATFAGAWLMQQYQCVPQLTDAAESVRQVVPQGELLDVVASEHVGYALQYYTDRRGWVIAPSLFSLADLQRHQTEGERYLVLFPDTREFLPEVADYLQTHARHVPGTVGCQLYRLEAVP